MGQSSPRRVPRTSARGRPKVTSSRVRLYSLARYLVASSATRATREMFLARILMREEAELNHSGERGDWRASDS